MLRLLIVLILVAHGIGHSIGVAGGWGANAWGGSGESWLLSPVLGRSVGILEGLVWLLPAIGFVAAGAALWLGWDAWRVLALASSVASLGAIALFPAQLPAFSAIAAVVVDVAVVVSLFVMEWPSADAVGA
ncbi:MAG TPA: hypothetical protein VFY43_05085 [Candidatus Limnocylindria bacterium]|nr:hypothetical protein [Candidatus Limnocylindria bacterium]